MSELPRGQLRHRARSRGVRPSPRLGSRGESARVLSPTISGTNCRGTTHRSRLPYLNLTGPANTPHSSEVSRISLSLWMCRGAMRFLAESSARGGADPLPSPFPPSLTWRIQQRCDGLELIIGSQFIEYSAIRSTSAPISPGTIITVKAC